MKKGTSLEKQAHPWKQPRETPKPAGGLTLPPVPRFWSSFALSAFQMVAPSPLGVGLALDTTLLTTQCWLMVGCWALPVWPGLAHEVWREALLI